MEQTPLSAADVAAVARNNSAFGGFGACNGYGMGMGYGAEWIWIVVLFALFGGGGFGWGNRGNGFENALTRTDLQQGFDNQTIQNKIDALGGRINSIGDGLCDGFYETTKNLMQGQNQLQRDLCQGFGAVSSQIAENRFAQEKCCCETNRNIDAVRYENAKNTCEIVRAIEKDGDETRKLIVANQIQDLRDKVAMQSQIIQTKDFALSKQAQNEYLVNTLKPCPIPAYVTCSPYESAYIGSRGFNGYNNSCGCGCGNY